MLTTPLLLQLPTESGRKPERLGHLVTSPFDQERNTDQGFPNLTGVVQFWDGRNPRTTVFAYLQPGYSLEIERPQGRIVGTTFGFDGDQEDIVRWADEGWRIKPERPYRLYVGAGDAPENWSKALPPGWKVGVWRYEGRAIEVPGAQWIVRQFNKDGTPRFGHDRAYEYAQTWDPTPESGNPLTTVRHMIVEPGCSLRTPALQGTRFTVEGGDRELLIKRFNQMVLEVRERDHVAPVLYYVGNSPVDGWSPTLPSDWEGICRILPTNRAGEHQVYLPTQLVNNSVLTRRNAVEKLGKDIVYLWRGK